MARTRSGSALKPGRRTRKSLERLRRFAKGAKTRGDIAEWRRVRAVISYVEGKPVIGVADHLGVTRGSVNRWLQWYNACGLDGLRSVARPGRPSRLTEAQLAELVTLIEAGPFECGFDAGIWTGPMIGELIRRSYSVKYHNHHVPKLLHSLGFSVQRPRKRLARTDAEKQEIWLRKRFPAIKKKPAHAVGLSCLRTKRASGSTGHCIEPGRLSDSNRALTRMGNERRLMCSGQ